MRSRGISNILLASHSQHSDALESIGLLQVLQINQPTVSHRQGKALLRPWKEGRIIAVITADIQQQLCGDIRVLREAFISHASKETNIITVSLPPYEDELVAELQQSEGAAITCSSQDLAERVRLNGSQSVTDTSVASQSELSERNRSSTGYEFTQTFAGMSLEASEFFNASSLAMRCT